MVVPKYCTCISSSSARAATGRHGQSAKRIRQCQTWFDRRGQYIHCNRQACMTTAMHVQQLRRSVISGNCQACAVTAMRVKQLPGLRGNCHTCAAAARRVEQLPGVRGNCQACTTAGSIGEGNPCMAIAKRARKPSGMCNIFEDR